MMKNLIIILSIIFISTFVAAKEGRVINVFYAYRAGGSIAVNLEHPKDRDGFLTTTKILMTSQVFEQCESVCDAEIVADSSNIFSIKLDGKVVAKVSVLDVDSLLPSESFSLTTIDGKLRLVLNFDNLKDAYHGDIKTKVVVF